jgi:hypothetical protein
MDFLCGFMLTTLELLIRVLKGNRPLCVEILHTGMSADFYKTGRQLREHSGGGKKGVRILECRQAVEEKRSIR